MKREDAWTDEDYGYLMDNMDQPAKRIAEFLGRSPQSVHNKRHRIRNGWEPRMQVWGLDEDDVIIKAGPYSTLRSLAEKLPGRTEQAIASRRIRLGVKSVNSNHKRPATIGARPLIAKTCRSCGLLLAADWFVWVTTNRQWSPTCKKCRSAYTWESRKNKGFTEEGREAAARSFNKQQMFTVANATRSGQPYTDEDHKVLSDQDLTLLQKALRLGRSYAAVRSMCMRSGYRSHVGLGDPERDQWKIDNPNAKEYTL